MQKRIRWRRRKRIRQVSLGAASVLALALVITLAVKGLNGGPGGDPAAAVPVPEITEAPGRTEAPAASQAPAETEAPAETPAPAETEAPAETQAPAETEAPAETQAPGWAEICVAESDYEYTDDTRFIHIDRIEQDGIVYFVADVQIKSASQFGTALSGGRYGGGNEALSAMAEKAGAVLAINADNYGAHEYGVIIRDGTLYRTRETTRNMLIVDQNADLSVRAERDGENPEELGNELIAQGVMHTFEFGPELVRDGAAVEFNPDFNVISTRSNRREPRTAIGQIGPKHYVIIVADGRQDGYSKGMTLQELQQLFVDYGAVTAMNLDGGGSSELWLNGEILNKPSGGKERSMSDIIWF